MTKKRYRATVWTLSARAEDVDGDAGIQRRVVTSYETSEWQFLARTMDALTRDVDDQVWFGPISCR